MSSLISEKCREPQLKRMFECAENGRIMHNGKCFEISKRGPCSESDILVLNKDSDVSFKCYDSVRQSLHS